MSTIISLKSEYLTVMKPNQSTTHQRRILPPNMQMGYCKIGYDGAKYNEIGPDCGKDIAVSLKYKSSLTIINLGKNESGPDGGNYIAESLKYNSPLVFSSFLYPF